MAQSVKGEGHGAGGSEQAARDKQQETSQKLGVRLEN